MSRVTLVPVPPEEIREGLYSVIGGALAGGAPAPSWVAVDDGTDAWFVEVSRRPAAERMRGVLAAAGEVALVNAQRLGVGGAMWLPPASLGALEAFSTADDASLPATPDAAVLELLEVGAPVHVVTFADRAFWRAQHGDRALTAHLADLAFALGVPAAIVPWPALVIASKDEPASAAAWDDIATRAGIHGLRIISRSLEESSTTEAVLDAAYGALWSALADETRSDSAEPQPVHELPHGRRVGWWNLQEVELEEEGWLATPTEVTPTKCRWRLQGPEIDGEAEEVLTSDEVSDLDGVIAARIPGWAARELRPGSPGGLLAARIAEAADRRGFPLWIPGVDEEGLRFVLGLPGTVWVDGPAVPD